MASTSCTTNFANRGWADSYGQSNKPLIRNSHSLPIDESLSFRWLNIGLAVFPGFSATTLLAIPLSSARSWSIGPFESWKLMLTAWVVSLLATIVIQAYLELKARYRGTQPARKLLRSCLFFLVLQCALCPGVILVLSSIAFTVLAVIGRFSQSFA